MATFTFIGFKWEADWDRDGTYGHVLSDISEYVNACTYRFGFDRAFQEVAPPARMILTLENATGAWSVAKSTATFNSVFKKGVLIRFSWIYLPSSLGVNVDSPHFIGTIKSIELTAGEKGEQLATLTVEDPMLQLLDTEYHPPLLTTVRTDQVLKQIFDDAALRFPYPHDYWMIGVAGASELDSTTILYSHTLTDFEQGQSTLDYAGDNADPGAGTTAQGYIRDIVRAEAGGKFFWDATTGKFVFWDRYFITNYDPATVFLPVVKWLLEPPPLYFYADDLMNALDVDYELKKLGTAASIIYTATNVPFSISAGQTRTFTARYRDPTVETARMGAINTIIPTPGVDYIANSASDGSGTSLTSSIGISVEFAANSAKVSIINGATVTAYITTFQLRGQPLTVYAKETATEIDGDSIFAYGEHRRRLSMPFLPNAEFAQDFARTRVQQFKTPYGRYERISRLFSNDPPASDLVVGSQETFVMGVGSRVELSVDGFLENLYRDYIVIGEQGQIVGDKHWTRTYILEPLARNAVWILDTSTLDETTILAL